MAVSLSNNFDFIARCKKIQFKLEFFMTITLVDGGIIRKLSIAWIYIRSGIINKNTWDQLRQASCQKDFRQLL